MTPRPTATDADTASTPLVDWRATADAQGLSHFQGLGYSKNAADLIRIVVAFGGFELRDILARVLRRTAGSGRTVNTHTVEAVLKEIKAEYDATAHATEEKDCP